MNQGRTVLSQITDCINRYEFEKIVNKYKGNYKTKTFSCWDHFLCLSFAQLSFRDSLRDIEICLNSQPQKLYHIGIRGNVSRTNLANANETRDWRIYADLAQTLISKARALYRDDSVFNLQIDETVYALDSSTIDLCLTLFPWAHFRKTKSAVKIHTLFDIGCAIPTYIEISDAKMSDVKILDMLLPETGAFYIMDRGYLDFARLFFLNESKAYFVTRAKKNLSYNRQTSRELTKDSKIRSDQIIYLGQKKSKESYPEKLRRIRFYDEESEKYFVFLTNNFVLSAETIAQLYKERWKIELFFKWIKQHLKIKHFLGTSENAVKCQIWIAICTYLLVAIIKKNQQIDQNLYRILQVISLSLFEKVHIKQLFINDDSRNKTDRAAKQLELFNL
jgi:hypothetical protein